MYPYKTNDISFFLDRISIFVNSNSKSKASDLSMDSYTI